VAWSGADGLEQGRLTFVLGEERFEVPVLYVEPRVVGPGGS
jgi:hypothetical protein